MKKSPTAPRAEYASKEVTGLMTEYAAWLTEQTGYTVDARSVFLSSSLRTAFQAERRAEKQAHLDSIVVPAKASPRKRTSRSRAVAPDNIDADPSLDDPQPKAKPRTRKRGSTIATAEGVVIAEQQHIDAVSA